MGLLRQALSVNVSSPHEADPADRAACVLILADGSVEQLDATYGEMRALAFTGRAPIGSRGLATRVRFDAKQGWMETRLPATGVPMLVPLTSIVALLPRVPAIEHRVTSDPAEFLPPTPTS